MTVKEFIEKLSRIDGDKEFFIDVKTHITDKIWIDERDVIIVIGKSEGDPHESS